MALAMNWARTLRLKFGTRLASTGFWFFGMALTVGACVEGPVATLVPMRCGVGSLTWIRVQTRGDVPPGQSTSEIVGSEVQSLDDLPDGIDAITVEGLFGTQVEAVGRTSVLQDEGELPVYFAPPDSVCGVLSPVAPREVGAVAVSERGHGLIIGGRDGEGRLLDDIVYFADTLDRGISTSAHLPFPALGQTIHAVGPSDFVVLGGAGANRRNFGSAVRLHVIRAGLVTVSDPIPLTFEGQALEGRAHHAAEVLPDGRILMTGGCKSSIEGTCEPAQGVLDGTWLIDGSTLTAEPGPTLLEPRFGHTLRVSRDGIAFVAGGWRADGSPAQTIEVRLADGLAWTPYGPSIGDWLEGGKAVLGATLIEGGWVVMALSDGTVAWVDPLHRGRLEDWCTRDHRCAHGISEPGQGNFVPRDLLTLPGERLLFDSFLLGPAHLNTTGASSTDLAAAAWEGAFQPPPARVGARTLLLRDGSVMIVGGWALTGDLANPWLARLRPALDGPDERIPELRTLEPSALVLHDPGLPDLSRITSSGATLRMTADESAGHDALSTWAHVRSFRSRNFRFEVVFTTLAAARPRLVFSAGAIARVEIHLDPDAIRFVHREPDGTSTTVLCDTRGIDFTGLGQALRVDASTTGIVVRIEPRVVRCPGLPGPDVAVGFGVVGQGSLVAQGLRLTR